MDGLRIYNVKWTSYSAGPSNDNNRRTEIFLAGCQKACDGNPCPGCFNKELWDKDNYCAIVHPKEAYEHIKKYAKNKFITFVGGEPLDQIEPLTILIELLAKDGYDIILITHHLWKDIFGKAVMNSVYWKLIEYCSIIIDGEYDENQRIWDESKAGDNIHDVIGSGNQTIIDLKRYRRINVINSWVLKEPTKYTDPKKFRLKKLYRFPAKNLVSWSMLANGDYDYEELGVENG